LSCRLCQATKACMPAKVTTSNVKMHAVTLCLTRPKFRGLTRSKWTSTLCPGGDRFHGPLLQSPQGLRVILNLTPGPKG
jgi:hypothetical protein